MLKDLMVSPIVVNFKTNTTKYLMLTASVLCAVACLIASSLHYTNRFYGNPVTWIGWVLGMLFLFLAYFPRVTDLQAKLNPVKGIQGLSLFFGLALLFFLSHLWNFQTAPWNQNGLFDDAAWDIHFAKSYILGGHPFQAAVFLDGNSAAREVIYHLYLIPFFKLLGFNLMTFAIALLILGFTTFVFTILLIHAMFKNYLVTITSALVLNFLPLHFIHTFVGHRYAIVAPLIMSSIYFLYTGYKRKSHFRIAVSSILAGLCFSSAIIGKQYLLGLVGALFLSLVFNFKKSFTPINWKLTKLFVSGVVISSLPLLVYIYYNQTVYFMNEGNYANLFFTTLKNDGWKGFMTYYTRMIDCLFNNTWYSWFLPDFVLIPIPYYLLLVPGVVIAFIKKQYWFITLALVAPAGAFVAGFSDYRVLHAAPFWVILMAFTIHAVVKIKDRQLIKLAGIGVSLLVVLAGLVPCIKYLDQKSRDPYSVWYFAQKDVAVTRFVRDIVAGVPNPSTKFRSQEFNKLEGFPEPDYDTLVCQKLGYAITHTFLCDYNDKNIMAFSDQMPFDLFEEPEILRINKNAIDSYPKGKKDLKLVWEITGKTNRIVEGFKKLNYLGSDQILSSGQVGQSFSLYILTIKNENIDEFKQKVKEIQL
jgi:hypothetical protein